MREVGHDEDNVVSVSHTCQQRNHIVSPSMCITVFGIIGRTISCCKEPLAAVLGLQVSTEWP